MITRRTWAIAGVSAALILVPIAAANAAATTPDATVATSVERVPLHAERQAIYGALGVRTGGMFGAAYGDQAQAQTRDQVRDQLRDTANCDGSGPTGSGPMAGTNAGRGGMMGGRS